MFCLAFGNGSERLAGAPLDGKDGEKRKSPARIFTSSISLMLKAFFLFRLPYQTYLNINRGLMRVKCLLIQGIRRRMKLTAEAIGSAIVPANPKWQR